MLYVRTKLVCALSILTLSSPALAWIWASPEESIQIEIESNQSKYQPGETAQLSAELRRIKTNGQISQIPPGHATGLETSCFFPDEANELPSEQCIRSGNINLQFTTGALSLDDVNTFTVKVGKTSPSTKALTKIKGKLDKRIAEIDQLIAHLSQQGAHPQVIQHIQKLRSNLKKVSDKIAFKLSSRVELIASYSFPLQVGNQVAAPSRYLQVMGGFQTEMMLSPGRAIEGEKVQASIQVTNISNLTPGMEWGNSPGGKYITEIFWKGQEVHQIGPQKIDPGQSISYNFLSEKLSVLATDLRVKIRRDLLIDFMLSDASLEVRSLDDSIAPIWKPGYSPNAQGRYVQTPQPINAIVEDAFGLIDGTTITASLTGETITGATVSRDLFSVLQTTKNGDGQSYTLTGSVGTLEDGEYHLNLSAKDLAQNFAEPNPLDVVFRLDRVAPRLTTTAPNNILTNNAYYPIDIVIEDHSIVSTSIAWNGQEVFNSTATTFIYPAYLSEGLNMYVVTTRDGAGNITTLPFVATLDTVLPVLTEHSPQDGNLLFSLAFPVSGKSSEKLASAKVNGQDLALSSDGLSFSGIYTAQMEGPQSLTYEISDLAQNKSQRVVNVDIVLKVLNENLISVVPSPDGNHLLIVGAQGAARPGSEVSASAGFFNSAEVIADQTGSFSITMNFFQTATVKGFDPATNRTDSATVSFQVDTRLSGIIRSADDGMPLPGVRVSVASNVANPVITDPSGVFAFNDPITGDQTLVVDPTALSPAVTGPNRKFFIEKLAITIGRSQSNILEPIYLTPLNQETSVLVSEGSGATVEDPHAPDVSLDIPSNVSVTFPDGNHTGRISISAIPSSRSTIPPIGAAVPDEVIVFQPAGTTFSEPVEITVGNPNEFPPESDVVFMISNSTTGAWEVGGIGRVSEDGQSITSKEGLGLRHFSSAYATIVGPKISAVGAQDLPGADSFGGAVSTTVNFPSFKSLGKDLGPSIGYKSFWAKPSLLVTNVLDIPRVELSATQSASRGIRGLVKTELKDTQSSWVEVEEIRAQLKTTGLESKVAKFKGVPNKAVLSYGLDLKNPETDEFLETGFYPYQSHYDIQLKRMILRTRETRTYRGLVSVPKIERTTTLDSNLIDEIFPQDLVYSFPIQNYAKSSAGRGWRIMGSQRIINPSENQVLLEEADGGLSSYSVADSSATAFNGQGISVSRIDGQVPLSMADGASFPDLNTIISSEFRIFDNRPNAISLDNRSVSLLGIRRYFRSYVWANDGYSTECIIPTHFIDSVRTPDGTYYILSDNTHAIYRVDSNGLNSFMGRVENPAIQPNLSTLNAYLATSFPSGNCPSPGIMGGSVPFGFVSPMSLPGLGGATIETAAFNTPKGIALHPFEPILVIADYGNHRVVSANLTTGEFKTIAGNGNSTDNGDGSQATLAGIFHPQQLAYDSVGNLFIATSTGLIRKVDTSGVISTVVGGPDATLANSAHGSLMKLVNPWGMAVDSDNGYLYVSDTTQNKIFRVDLTNYRTVRVAGTGLTGFNGDGNTALETNLNRPTFIKVDPDHNLLVLESEGNRVRKIVFQNNQATVLTFKPSNPDNTQLTKNGDGTWLRKYRNGNQVTFNSAGYEVESSDLIGRIVQTNYDNLYRITSQVDPVGRVIQYHYSGEKLDAIEDPVGRVSHLSFDGDLLREVRFPDGSTRGFQYDEDGLLLSETNPQEQTTQYVYNEWNRVQEIIRPDGERVIINDSASGTAQNSVDGIPKVVSSYGPGENQIHDLVKDANGNATVFVKGTNGYVAQVVDAEDISTKIDRDDFGRPLKLYRNYKENDPGREDDDQWDSALTYTYNSFGDVIHQEDDFAGIEVTKTYDSFGNITSETNGRGFTTTRVFDPATGLLMSETNPTLDATQYTYRSLGLVQNITTPQGLVVSYQYDSFGNVIQKMDPRNGNVSYVRDDAGNITQATNSLNQITKYEYDDFNRLIAVVSPKNERTTYRYLPSGELAAVTDPKNNIVNYEYDEMGHLLKKTDALGLETIFSYDPNGNLLTERDPKLAAQGQIKSFVYDKKNRVIQKTLPDNSYTFEYNAHGKLVRATNNVSQIEMDLDVLDRITSVTAHGQGDLSSYPSVTLSYTYDLNGNRSSLLDPTGSTTYTYDNSDRLIQVTNSSGQIYHFDIVSDRLERVRRPGSETRYNFDSRGLTSLIAHVTTGGTNISSHQYGYDSIGRKTLDRKSTGDRVFGYNENSQLTSATQPEATSSTSLSFQSEIFQYDEIANRLSDQGGTYSYDTKAQRLVEDYKYFYHFDVNGNLISKQEKAGFPNSEVTNYTYSSESQLISVSHYRGGDLNPNIEIYYSYDALGRRIQKRVIDHDAEADVGRTYTRQYVYDGEEVLLEYNEDENLLARYTHSSLRTDDVLAVNITTDGQAYGLATSAGTYQYLKDSQGTITDIVTNTGQKIQHYVYSAFGILLGIQDANATEFSGLPPVRTTYTYTGREYERETGTYYYRARYYDPQIGRFLQKDPEPGSLKEPLTLTNPFVYVMNNPLNLVDPTGRLVWFLLIPLVMAGVSAGTSIIWNLIKGKNIGEILIGALKAAIGGLIGGLGIVGGLALGAAITGAASGAALLGTEAGVIYASLGGALGGAIGGGLDIDFKNGKIGWNSAGAIVGAGFGLVGGLLTGAAPAGIWGTVLDIQTSPPEVEDVIPVNNKRF